MAAITKPIESLELRQHLGVGLGAGHAPIKLDNVAKLASKRVPTGELNPDVEIIIEFQQVEAWDRTLGHVDRESFCLEQPLGSAGFPGGNELVDDPLGFAEDTEIGARIDVGTGGDGGAADYNRLAVR